ncbi:MAG: UDP-N-acetylmuramoyl-L-alanyl-D-glutamate--2,6-diaminopimelate ligase [Limnohabitans sp.]
MTILHDPIEVSGGLRERVTGALCTDSRRVQPGDGFIAWPGAVTDGRQYLADALAQGAAACLLEAEGAQRWSDLLAADALRQPHRLACVPSLKALTGPIANAWYDRPSDDLQVLAVTGTNGKTSTTWWLAQALSHSGRACALVGTLGTGRPPVLETTGMTTPDPVRLQQAFRSFADRGWTHCAIEASSIGLAEHRLAGTRIHVAIFTNFTQDHLDYHGSMQAYWEAKLTLFDWPGLRLAVVNLDDPQGPALADRLQARGSDLWTCSRHQRSARLFGHTQVSAQGLSMQVFEGPQSARLETALIGDYNLDNLLGVIAAQRACGVPLEEAVQACTALTPVPGRMQRVPGPEQSPAVVVDYAHTPDAVRQALSALEPLAQVRGGQLWCVLGCGGDRDPFKRPLMAAAAESGAARLVFTSDNPRSEAPEDILRQMVQGLQTPQAVTVIADRAEAIDWSVRHAAAQDVILLAGKGHETTQDIGGRLLPFSDMEQAGRALASRTNGVQEQAA